MNRYLPRVKRYSWVVLVCCALGLIGAFTLLRLFRPTYIASSTVLIQVRAPGVNITSPSAQDPAGSVDAASTYAAEIPTRAVMTFIFQQYPQIGEQGYSVDDLLNDVTATPSTTAATILVQASAWTPEASVVIANAVANGFTAYLQQQVQQQLAAMRSNLQSQLDSLNKQKAAIDAALAKIPTGSTATTTTTVTNFGSTTTTSGSGTANPLFEIDSNDLASITQLIGSVQQQLLQVPVESSGDASVIQLAAPGDAKTTGRLTLSAAAVGTGLVLGVLLLLLLVFIDDRLLDDEQVKEKLGLTYLGGLSSNPKLKRYPTPAARLSVQEAANIYASLRLTGTLPRARHAPEGSVLLVTSAAAGAGKSTTAAALGAAVARGGGSAVLVDADLRQPATHLALRMNPADGGLSDALTSEQLSNLPLQASDVSGLWLLPAGDALEQPTFLLEQRMPALLTELRQQFDLVIVDAPALLSDADAVLLANMVDGVVLVVDIRHDKLPLLRRASGLLSLATHTPVGVVLNRLPAPRPAFIEQIWNRIHRVEHPSAGGSRKRSSSRRRSARFYAAALPRHDAKEPAPSVSTSVADQLVPLQTPVGAGSSNGAADGSHSAGI